MPYSYIELIGIWEGNMHLIVIHEETKSTRHPSVALPCTANAVT